MLGNLFEGDLIYPTAEIELARPGDGLNAPFLTAEPIPDLWDPLLETEAWDMVAKPFEADEFVLGAIRAPEHGETKLEAFLGDLKAGKSLVTVLLDRIVLA